MFQLKIYKYQMDNLMLLLATHTVAIILLNHSATSLLNEVYPEDKFGNTRKGQGTFHPLHRYLLRSA